MLAALGGLAVTMAVLAPHVYRSESTVQAVAWTVMLVATIAAVALLGCAEVLIRCRARHDEAPGA
ncbi:hypothetical protein SAMN05444716_1174 [Streptomyces harbinensis]|uniref:Uncharacterized protein n=2 Tax=Streptomyces TaxID=1883 RepID=A0A1I6WBW2_9ACTN|nr:hypothetical protein SAMN05444716_1174 [Streptomyces harbinensis]